jgi:thiol:disulfide interchange protein
MLLVVATASWLRALAALAMLGVMALALPALLRQRQRGEGEDGGD